jgi:hypothetical protein
LGLNLEVSRTEKERNAFSAQRKMKVEMGQVLQGQIQNFVAKDDSYGKATAEKKQCLKPC